MRRRILLPTLLFLGGCAVTNGQTAHTLGQGNVQVAVEPAILAGDGIDPSSRRQQQETEAGVAVRPAFYLAGRYGLRDDLDVGVRLGTIGYEGTLKWRFTEEDAPVIMSFAPSGALVVIGVEGVAAMLRAKAPVLFGIPYKENQFVLAPNVETWLGVGGGKGESAGGVLLSLGFSAGYAIRVSKAVQLMPEVGVSQPAFGGLATSGDRIAGFEGGLLAGGSFAIIIGGK